MALQLCVNYLLSTQSKFWEIQHFKCKKIFELPELQRNTENYEKYRKLGEIQKTMRNAMNILKVWELQHIKMSLNYWDYITK